MKCDKCGREQPKSSAQRNRIHKLFTLLQDNVKAKDGLYHHKEWWKLMCKDRWLEYEKTLKPDGEYIYRMKSTEELDMAEYTEFMNKVEEYCHSRGVWLEE